MGSRLLILGLVISSAVLVGSAQSRVEDFSFLAGRWQAEPSQAVTSRFGRQIDITASKTEISISKAVGPTFVFRADGTTSGEIHYGTGQTWSAMLVGNGVAFTTRRIRTVRRVGPSGETLDGQTATIYTDLYSVDRDVLTVDSRLSQSQPDGSLVNIEGEHVKAVFRRVP